MSVAARVIHLIDEAPGGTPYRRAELRLVSESMSVRELITRRVESEVAAFNGRQQPVFEGLVQPSDTEKVLNGYQLKKPRQLDAGEQVARALEAFERGGFLLLVGDEQLDELDARFVVEPGLEVHFIKLVPLVGG